MFQKTVENIVCANCGKRAKNGVQVSGMDMFGKVWNDDSVFGFNCATELFGCSKKVILLACAANQEKIRLENEGWQHQDFAQALKEML